MPEDLGRDRSARSRFERTCTAQDWHKLGFGKSVAAARNESMGLLRTWERLEALIGDVRPTPPHGVHLREVAFMSA